MILGSTHLPHKFYPASTTLKSTYMFILLKSSLAYGDLLFYLYLDIMLLQQLLNPVFEKINLNKCYTKCIILTMGPLQGHISTLILQSLQKDTNLQVLVEKLLKSTNCLLERFIHPHRRRDHMMYCDPFCGCRVHTI